jgi:hypothetical protein
MHISTWSPSAPLALPLSTVGQKEDRKREREKKKKRAERKLNNKTRLPHPYRNSMTLKREAYPDSTFVPLATHKQVDA